MTPKGPPRFEKINLERVAISARCESDGTLQSVSPLTLFEKIKAAIGDPAHSINTVVLAEEQLDAGCRKDYFNDLAMQECFEINGRKLPFEHTFYRHKDCDFWIVFASSLDDIFMKLQESQRARWEKLDLNLPPRDPCFTGRERLFNYIEKRIADNESGYTVVIAEMGRGKTAFMTELTYRAKHGQDVSFGTEPPLYHFVRPTPENPQKSDELAENLYAQLRRNYQRYDDSGEGKTSRQKLSDLMAEISETLKTDGRKQLIVIDAADQLGTDEPLLYGAFIRELPPGFHCVITSRSDVYWMNDHAKQSGVCCVKFDDLFDQEPLVDDERDIKEYLAQMNDAFRLGIQSRIIEQVAGNKKTPPVFFVVHYLVDVLRGRKSIEGLVDESGVSLSEERLQTEYFHWLTSVDVHINREIACVLDRARKSMPKSKEAACDFVCKLLGVLSIAYKPLSQNMLETLVFSTVKDKNRLKKFLSYLKNFFIYQPPDAGNDVPFVFGHPHYIEAICARKDVRDHLVNLHASLADHCDQWNEIENVDAHRYALKYRLAHRIKAYTRTDVRWKKLAAAFADMEYIEKRSERKGFDDFVGIYEDAREAMKIANEKTEDTDWGDWPKAFQDWEQFLRWRLEFFRNNSRMYPQEIVNEFHSKRKCFCDLLKKSARAFLKNSFWLKKVKGPAAWQPIGHSGYISCLAVSSNHLIASGDGFGKIKIWDMKSGVLLHDCLGHINMIVSVSFSPDGSQLVSISDHGIVKIWDVESGELLHDCLGGISVDCVSFSPNDGSHVVSGGKDGAVKIWDVRTGQLLHDCLRHARRVTTVSYSPDELRVVSGSEDGTIKIWDVGAGEWLHDSLGGGGSIKMWDVEDGEWLHNMIFLIVSYFGGREDA